MHLSKPLSPLPCPLFVVAALAIAGPACGGGGSRSSSSLPPAAATLDTPAAAEDAPPVLPLRVMSFNLRYDNPADGDDAWPHRADLVAEVIASERPDVLGVQEALRSMLDDLDARLPSYRRFGVGRADGADGGEFSAIYVRRERFELLREDTFWLSETPEIPGSRSWDADVERVATWGELRDRKTGRRFVALNTHFDHRGVRARVESATLLLERLASIAADLPVVVTGDLNATPDSEPVVSLTRELLRDSRAIAAERVGPSSTWNGFEAIVPGRRIDYVFVGGPIEVQRYRALDRTFDGRFPSDHLPIVVDLIVGAPPEAAVSR